MPTYYRVVNAKDVTTEETVGGEVRILHRTRQSATNAMEELPWDEAWGVEPELKVQTVEMTRQEVQALGYTVKPTRMGRPSHLPEPWQTLVALAGSVQGLATKFDVSPGTVRRWAIGEIAMSGPAKKILNALLYGPENFKAAHPDTSSVPLKTLPLSIRAQWALTQAGLSTIGDLLRQNEQSLFKQGLSKSVLKEIRRELAFIGLVIPTARKDTNNATC